MTKKSQLDFIWFKFNLKGESLLYRYKCDLLIESLEVLTEIRAILLVNSVETAVERQ